ncbi:hypothetical protein, partial [Billgrantia endophytica]|uniref:hypothetical protein n=1 Tax=Billgrantia endophytica TaxID=2033802 RepID=UPI00197AE7C9
DLPGSALDSQRPGGRPVRAPAGAGAEALKKIGIFQVALSTVSGLVGDLFELLPELESRL